MKNNTVHRLAFLWLFLLIQMQNTQAQNLVWAKQQGGTGDDYCNSIAVDNAGNVYSTGSFSGTADFDPGPGIFNLTAAGLDDIFISKLDASGNLLWAKRIGGVGSDLGFSIAITPTNELVLTGWFSSTADFDPGAATVNLTSAGQEDVFIAKFDVSGNYVWAKKIGSTNSDRGTSITTNTAGEIFLTGYFYFTVDFDPGSGVVNIASAGFADVFILKLTASGNYVWVKKIGGTSNDISISIAIDTLGNIFTTGGFYGPGACDFDPSTGVFSLTATNNESDIFLSKLNASGNFIWAKQIGSTGVDSAASLVLDNAGNVYLTGYFSSEMIDFDPGIGVYNLTTAGFYDVFITKLDTSGNLIWAKNFGDIGADFGQAIAVDVFGNVYTTGETQGDIFLSKIDADGNFVWTRGMSGFSNYEDGRSIQVIASTLYVAGRFASSVDFDPDSAVFNMTSAGQSDSFICKLGGVLDTEEVSAQRGFSLYPNPAGEQFTITSANFQNTVAELYTLQGQLLQRISLVSTSTTVQTSALAKGTYVLYLKNETGIVVHKLIKQ